MKYYFEGNILESKLEILHFGALLKSLRHLVGKPLLITIEILTNKRSLAQNRYLHGVILPIIIDWYKETHGAVMTKDAAKAFIYKEILQHQVVITEILGTEVITFEGKNFSQQNTKEFINSVKLVQEFFDFFEVYIPDPKEKNVLHEFI